MTLYLLSPIGFLAFLRFLSSRKKSLMEAFEAKKEAQKAKEESENKSHDARSKALDDYAWPAFRLKSAYDNKEWSEILLMAEEYEKLAKWNSSIWARSTKPEAIIAEEFNLVEALREVMYIVEKTGFMTSFINLECDESFVIKTDRTLFQRLMYNSLVNAIRASIFNERCTVTVSAIESRDKVKIFVSNYGSINASLLDKGRSDLDSTGLGTHIIKEIGDSLKANLDYINTEERVTLCFEFLKVRSHMYCY